MTEYDQDEAVPATKNFEATGKGPRVQVQSSEDYDAMLGIPTAFT